MKTNQYYINEYITTRDLSQSTKNSLTSIINHYTKHQNQTMHELLQEADLEEEQGIRWKNRTLKTRLTAYQNHLKNTMDINSATTYFRTIKTFYRHHEIEIGILPVMNKRNAKIGNPITYNDLPDKKIIRQAVELSNPLWRSIIMFLATTGMAKVDMRNLQIQDLLKSTYTYHYQDNITDAVDIMQKLDVDIIPVWKQRRSKTNKYFITFNTPEATKEILNYLQNRLEKQEVKNTDKLFPVHEHYFTKKFEVLNDMMGLGTAGVYCRFRGHMLRKFHASALSKGGMERYKINVLQGKSNGAVDDVYFYEDENKLKEDYMNAMGELLIFSDFVAVDSPAVASIKSENSLLKSELADLKDTVNDILKWYKQGD